MQNPIYRFDMTDGNNIAPNYGSYMGYYMNGAGVLSANAGYNTTGFIPVVPGTIYLFARYYTMVTFDASQTVVSYDFTKVNRLWTIPANVRYVRMCLRVADWSNLGLEATRLVKPTYKEDLAKDWELETNQRFYRAKLSGKLSFIRDDYDFIMAQNFEAEYKIVMRKSNDNGHSWIDPFISKFMRTDCIVNENDKKIQVQPDVLDDYNDVLAGMEKEYNLITLKPTLTSLTIQKRPLIQVYIPGDTVVSCFLGGTYWEQDANEVTDRNALISTYHFALCNMLKEIQITMSSGASDNATGLYTGRMTMGENNTFTGTLTPQTATGYRIVASQVYNPPFWGIVNYSIVRTSDNVVVYSYSFVSPGNIPWDNATFNMTAQNGATGTANADMKTYNIYVRYLLDVETIAGLNTYPVPSDDIVENNRNYTRCIGYAIDVAYISNRTSTEPTEWGLQSNGVYFEQPYSFLGDKFYPIARSTWRYASIWFAYTTFDWILEEQGRKPYTLKDAYPLDTVIKRLLEQFAPGITHEPTAEYSQFLYAAQNPISYQSFTVLLTQKSNVLTPYDQPAQKAPVTLQQITAMLRDCFRCFWFIEDGKFKIEHILWFKNGGSYSYNPELAADLTTLINRSNGLTWGFDTSEYQFDKVDMPERYQFEWMDDVTPAFIGSPINVLSKYVTAGKIEEINISNFTSDIDYMMLNPGEISKDGFALFAAIGAPLNYRLYPNGYMRRDGQLAEHPTAAYYRVDFINGRTNGNYIASGVTRGALDLAVYVNASGNVISTQYPAPTTGEQTYTDVKLAPPAGTRYIYVQSIYQDQLNFRAGYDLPFVQRDIDGETLTLQNGYMSFITLQPNYWLYDMPARRVQVNGVETYAYGIERKKKQTVSYPSIDDPDPMKLVKTPMGTGQFDKISINLSSRMNKCTLKYDTE